MVLRRIAAPINRPCLIETQKSPLAALAYMVAVRPASQTLLARIRIMARYVSVRAAAEHAVIAGLHPAAVGEHREVHRGADLEMLVVDVAPEGARLDRAAGAPFGWRRHALSRLCVANFVGASFATALAVGSLMVTRAARMVRRRRSRLKISSSGLIASFTPSV